MGHATSSNNISYGPSLRKKYKYYIKYKSFSLVKESYSSLVKEYAIFSL